jgi:hypothetical protein
MARHALPVASQFRWFVAAGGVGYRTDSLTNPSTALSGYCPMGQ